MTRKKTVIVTGASGWLGKAISQRFFADGCQLILVCRDASGMADKFPLAKNTIPPKILIADLAFSNQIRSLFEKIQKLGIVPDILINNAGVQDIQRLTDIDSEDWDKMMTVNLRAPHLCTKHFVALAKSGDKSIERSIVNISSIESENPAIAHSHYDASKAGLLQYSRAAALELGSCNIRVNCISPGLIERPGIENDWPDGVKRYKSASPLGCLVSPEDVAEVVYFLCSEAAKGVNGVNLRVDTGIGSGPGY